MLLARKHQREAAGTYSVQTAQQFYIERITNCHILNSAAVERQHFIGAAVSAVEYAGYNFGNLYFSGQRQAKMQGSQWGQLCHRQAKALCQLPEVARMRSLQSRVRRRAYAPFRCEEIHEMPNREIRLFHSAVYIRSAGVEQALKFYGKALRSDGFSQAERSVRQGTGPCVFVLEHSQYYSGRRLVRG